MVAAFETSLQINRDQATIHLETLGYKQDDAVFVRYIHPVTKESIKAQKLDFAQANNHQAQGRDVYFVVNGGGDSDEQVTECRAIFYEHDHLDKELQLYLWEQLGLPQPTIQIDTGGKSIHSYWVLNEPIPPEPWKQLQSDLLEFSDGDRTIKNPSRILRLAGSCYMKGDNPGTTAAEIITNSGVRYTYEELRAIIPPKTQLTFETRQVATIDSGDNIPLYQCLTKDDRALIDGGVGEGSRNSSGAKLARNLLGTSARLNYLGHRYDGDPRQLFDDYCNRCSPALDAKEADSIWRSAEKDNPTATLTDDALENCVKAWQRNQVKATGKSFGSKNLQRTTQSTTHAKNKSSDPDERLRLDLLALLKETDPIKKIRLRAEICSYYRLSKSEVDEMLRHLKKRTSTQETKVYTLDQLFALESEGLQWLIPELLPKGETIILAGSPKAGKTLLAIDAAFAIATGESSFLGEATPRGKVLLVSCDESLNSTKNKLLKRGFRECDRDYIKVLPQWSIDDIDLLEAQLEDFRPDVVIIDSLRRITHGSPISENSAEFADNIYTLKETISRYGASGILIHHANKDREAMGVGKLRGSSAIAGAVWGTWQLDHIPQPDPNNKNKLIIDPKDPRRILSVFARDTEGQSLNIEFNPEDNSWRRLDEEVQAEQQTVRERIISVLIKNSHCPGLSGKQIIELLSMATEEGRGIYTELNRMANKRLINCKPASGDKRVNLYSLSITQQPLLNKGDSPPPIPCVPIVEYLDESLTVQGLDNTQQDTQQLLNNYSTTVEVNTPVEYLEPSNGKGFSDTQQPTQKKGGEGVPSVVESSQYTLQSIQDTASNEEAIATTTSAISATTPITPPAPSHNFAVGDVVQVLDRSKLKGKRFVVSTVDGNDLWLREQKQGFTPPSGPYYPHQLRKLK